MSSIANLNSRANLKANGRLGSYLPVSIAFTVCRETPSFSAKSDCDHPFAVRMSRTWFFICSGGSRSHSPRNTGKTSQRMLLPIPTRVAFSPAEECLPIRRDVRMSPESPFPSLQRTMPRIGFAAASHRVVASTSRCSAPTTNSEQWAPVPRGFEVPRSNRREVAATIGTGTRQLRQRPPTHLSLLRRWAEFERLQEVCFRSRPHCKGCFPCDKRPLHIFHDIPKSLERLTIDGCRPLSVMSEGDLNLGARGAPRRPSRGAVAHLNR